MGKEGIKVGDVVVIHDDTPRLKWQLAVVKDLQRGNDNVVRSATIRTVNGVTSRPVVKLYPLKINVETERPVEQNIVRVLPIYYYQMMLTMDHMCNLNAQ